MMSQCLLSGAKSQAHQVLAIPYHADFEESPAVASEEVESIEVIAGNLDGEADLDLAYLREVPTYIVEPASVVTMGVFRRRAWWLVSQLPR